jgi:tight adherence protein C
MRSTGLLVMTSVVLCVALLLVITAWREPRPSLDRSIRRLHRAPQAGHGAPLSVTRRFGLVALASPIATPIADPIGDRSTRWRQSLRLIGRDIPAHLGVLVIAALLGLIVPALVLGVLHVSGWVSISLVLPLGVAVLGAAAAPIAVHADAMARSDDLRVDVRHQLSAYLDMVTMLLAGNTGHEGALEQAARAGDGLLFVELRRRMREVGTTGQSLVRALALVGDDFGVVELEQVAATAQLSANEGAPVARTLAAKCSTLRSTLAAEQEASARVRNDKVTPPLVGMAVLFMALIIYPALNL